MLLMINSKTILGFSLAAIFAVSMMSLPSFADHPVSIEEADDFEMEVEGLDVGDDEPSSPITVYAFFTDTTFGDGSFIAYVAADHLDAGVDDVDEQGTDAGKLHAHQLRLDGTSLCILEHDFDVGGTLDKPLLEQDGNEIEIIGAEGDVNAWVIAQYDGTPDGVCPVHVIDFVSDDDDD